MNIAFIIPSLSNSGPILVVKELVHLLLKEGYQCTVFYFDEIREVNFDCSTVKIKFRNKLNFDQFDIIHSHGIRPDAYVYFHKPKYCKTKFVSTLHNYMMIDLTYQYNKLVSLVFGNLWIRLLRKHDKIVVLSHDAMTYYQQWFDHSKLSCVCNTRELSGEMKLNVKEQSLLSEFKGNSVLIGVNALLTERKGIDLLLKAMALLPEYKLWIVGSGKIMDKLKLLSKSLDVTDRVYFAGYRENAFRYLPFYDVYAMPSRSEGFPLALLEAAIMKVPTVCSDIPIFRELFSSDEVVFFELENIISLANAVRTANENLEMGRQFHQRYLSSYSPISFFKGYQTVYNSLK